MLCGRVNSGFYTLPGGQFVMFAFVFRLVGRSHRVAAPRKTKQCVVPNLEALEERWMPSATGGVSNLQALLSTNPNTVNTNSVASAPTQQVTATFTPFTTGGSQTQSVAQFNPALGTL